MEKYKSKFLNIPGYIKWRDLQRVPKHKLHYLEWGDENNPNTVICVHGLARNCRDFDKVADKLSEKFRVIAIDMVGRGKSEWFKNKKLYNYPTYCQDILKFMDLLDLKKVHWLGSSMGGIIGMLLSAGYPKYIKSLVLNDIGPFIPGKSVAKVAKYLSLNPAFDNFDDAKSYVKVMLSPFNIPEHEFDYVTLNSTSMDSNGKYRLAFDPGVSIGMKLTTTRTKDLELWDYWNKINVPIMVIRGGKSNFLDKETFGTMLDTKKNIKLYSVPEAGHTPSLMEEDQINEIMGWLKYNTKEPL